MRTGEERNIIMFRARSARPQAISYAREIAEAGLRKTAMRFICDWPTAFCVPVISDPTARGNLYVRPGTGIFPGI